ncbi:2-oxoacid:acceptor oxidoreductase, partial [Neisseria sp. P0020.S003]
QADGGVLSADFVQMDDDFMGWVKDGRYKKVSASFYPPDSPSNPKPCSWYLRRVVFLGAQPPAVKGLSAINFA